MDIKEAFNDYISGLQFTICDALEKADGLAVFHRDKWTRPEGGGGLSCVISDGNVFEKGGVNTSAVFGKLPEAMQQAFGVGESRFFILPNSRKAGTVPGKEHRPM